MPSKSKAQHALMQAVAHSPAFAKKVGIPQSVGRDFAAADIGRKFAKGGSAHVDELERLLAKYPNPKSVLNAPMLRGPDAPELRSAAPGLYGFLGGAMGIAPDEFEGSVLDPLTEKVRAGAEVGFPIGTALQMLPGAGPLKAMLAKYSGTGPVGRSAQRGVVKMGGGQWPKGNVEGIVEGMKRHALSPEDIALATRNIDEALAGGTVTPEYVMGARRRLETESSHNALNAWIDKQLTRYIKNQMATPEDPIRALAEKGTLHYVPDPEQVVSTNPGLGVMVNRERAGFDPDGMAQSDLAKYWENASDFAIRPGKASEYLEDADLRGNSLVEKHLSQNPWLAKVPPETPVHSVYGGRRSIEDVTKFGHLIDELRNATSPASSLPLELQLKYSSLPQVSVPQAVERVAKINAWRAANKAELDAQKARNAATHIFKDYPEQGFQWVELAASDAKEIPKGFKVEEQPYKDYVIKRVVSEDGSPVTGWVGHPGQGDGDVLKAFNSEYYRSASEGPLKDALSYEGDIMGHCVGGYCPDVLEGRSRIFSLRDAKGQPHVTIETRPGTKAPEGTMPWNQLPEEVRSSMTARGLKPADKSVFESGNVTYDLQGKSYISYPDEIIQIKGKSNLKPNDEYLPFVQDFVRSGNWLRVGDLPNTGLVSYRGQYMPESELTPMVQDALQYVKTHPAFEPHREATRVLGDAMANSQSLRGLRQPAGRTLHETVPYNYREMMSLLEHPEEWVNHREEIGNQIAHTLRQVDKLKAVYGDVPKEGFARGGSVDKSELERLLAKYPNPKSVLNAPMIQRDTNSPYLREAAPEAYGFLGGVAGTAPDEFEGSVLDPLTQRVREGAERGFPIGTVLQVLPGLQGLMSKYSGPVGRSAQRGVLKMPGGQWPKGNVENAMRGLKTPEPNRAMIDADRAGAFPPLTDEEFAARVARSKEIDPGSYALNSWIDKQLTRYIKNQMATPEDPVRALAEQGILHYQPPPQIYGPGVNTERARVNAGFPAGGMGKSELAKDWESISDRTIRPNEAGSLLRDMDFDTLKNPWLEDNPWLAKVPPDTMVHTWDRGHRPSNLGFNHLIDELRNATNPESGLPPELLLKYSSLPQVSVPQAVERVAKINAWRAAQKAEADLARANNAATALYKDYPEQGFRWVELKEPAPTLPEGYTIQTDPRNDLRVVMHPQGYPVSSGATDEEAIRLIDRMGRRGMLEDALKYEGDTMGHCVGGYCPDVLEGRSRIFSLRDKKGQPHVTIETRPNDHLDYNRWFGRQTDEVQNEITRRRLNDKSYNVYETPEYLAERQAQPPSIKQIKGKSNLKPNDEYLPFVQDFVRSGRWSDVGDLQNAGLYEVSKNSLEDLANYTPSKEGLRLSRNDRKAGLARAHERGYLPEQGYVTRDEWEGALRKALMEDPVFAARDFLETHPSLEGLRNAYHAEANFNGRIPSDEYSAVQRANRQSVAPDIPYSWAELSHVLSDPGAYGEDTLAEVMRHVDTLRQRTPKGGFARGGSVHSPNTYDPARIDALVAQLTEEMYA